MHLVDWSSFISAERAATDAETSAARGAWSAAQLKSAVALGNSGDAAPIGDARLAAIRRCLDSFEGFPRSDAQRRFHEAFLRATLPHIFGGDFERHRDRILAANGMERVEYDCLVCTPRRCVFLVFLKMPRCADIAH